MSAVSIGIVDYGMGNQASVIQSLRALGFRVWVGSDASKLDAAEILIIPGVGAFPTAMEALRRQGLVEYLRRRAANGGAIIGICLGMQLLASSSNEYGQTAGLDLIPGEIAQFANAGWHIGWNAIDVTNDEALFRASDQEDFYFNHSYYFRGSPEFVGATVEHNGRFAAIIRRGRIVGLQFHPEKSQAAGRRLLANMIEGLTGA